MPCPIGTAYALLVTALRLLARAVPVVGKDGVLDNQQMVSEEGQEPDYEAALAEIRKLL